MYEVEVKFSILKHFYENCEAFRELVREVNYIHICQEIGIDATGSQASRIPSVEFFVKLRQGSGKDQQGMAVKVKGLKA